MAKRLLFVVLFAAAMWGVALAFGVTEIRGVPLGWALLSWVVVMGGVQWLRAKGMR